MSLISPLNRVLGLGSAKGGTDHWWAQRLTALALIPLGLWLVFSLGAVDTSSYAAVLGWIQQPLNGILLLSTILAVVYHSYLGVQVVLEDYVHGAAKVVMVILSALGHGFLGVASIYAVLRVGLGAP